MTDALEKHPAAGTRDAARQRLMLTIDSTLRPPSPDHSLLVAFFFGQALGKDGPLWNGQAPGDREDGTPDDGQAHENESNPAIIDAGLHPIESDNRYESWWYRGKVTHRNIGDIRISECDDYAFVTLQRTDTPKGKFRQSSYDAYRDLLKAIATTRHEQLVRIWNYFPDINDGEGDSEKYRQFSIGRAEAFEEADVGRVTVPAGTATGCASGGPLSIVALVSKNEFRAAENPRQVSAYRYPRQYGPKSPKFSRGGTVAASSHHLYLISGTAAVVGHESAHPYDTEQQIGETLENLRHIGSVLPDGAAGLPQFELDAECVLRVYLRSPDDYDIVATTLRESLGSFVETSGKIVFLHADICRRELMVEIDGTRCF